MTATADTRTAAKPDIDPEPTTLTQQILVGVFLGVPMLALLAAVALWFLLSKTKWGLELNAVGLNPKAAEYAGIKVGRMMILSMVISGALAGLAGVSYYLGFFKSINPGELTSVGFDSIAVALLGNIHPLGAILSTALITTLTYGAVYMSSVVGVRQEITSLIVGMVLLFSACAGFIKLWVERSRRDDAELVEGIDGPNVRPPELTAREVARDSALWNQEAGEPL
jgi:simple sugar transport system permease protein